MRITELLSKLITEQSRFQVLYDKMVKPAPTKEGQKGKPKGIMDFEVLKNIIFADPTTKAPENFDKEGASIQDMDNVKVGKYVQWLLKNFISPKPIDLDIEGEVDPNSKQFKAAKKEYERLFLEDLYKQTERLEFYEKAKQYLPQEQRDINKLSIKDLFNIFANFQLPEKKKKAEEKKEAKKSREGFNHKGGEIMFQGPNWTLIKISDKGQTGKDAAIWYGGYKDHRNGESDWCTSSPGLTYFDGYIKDGPLYVIFPNDDKGEVGARTGLPKERYQFHFPSNQFMDRDDHQVNLVEFLNGKMSELKEYFKPEFAKGLLKVGGKKLDISYPSSSAGKFIALYGFDELFESIPDDVQNITINNNSNEDIALDVPKSIGRFKQLDAIMLNNIVRSIPDEIGQLPLLGFLALPNNKKLVSLPESIANLEQLTFINLKGSNPNVKIPPKLKQKMNDEGGGFYFVE